MKLIVNLIKGNEITTLLESEKHSANTLINWLVDGAWEPDIFDKKNQYIIQTESGQILVVAFFGLEANDPVLICHTLAPYQASFFEGRKVFLHMGCDLTLSKDCAEQSGCIVKHQMCAGSQLWGTIQEQAEYFRLYKKKAKVGNGYTLL